MTRFKLFMVALFWGGTFVAARAVGMDIAPPVIALARFVVATAVLALLAQALEGGLPRLDRRMLLLTVLLGFLGVFAYNSFFFAAIRYIPASRAAILVSAGPAVIALTSALALGHNLNRWRWCGIGIAFLGALVVITHGDLPQIVNGALGRGECLMLAAVASWALYTVASQQILGRMSPIAATTYAALWGTIMLALYAIPSVSDLHLRTFTVQNILSILYIAIPGTAIAYWWYFDGVKELGAARAAVFNNFVPVSGVVLSALLLHERLQLSTVLGGLMVLAGVVLTNRRSV